MSKAARREARERIKQQRLAEERKRKRNKVLVIGAAVVVVALILGGGYFWFASDRDGGDTEVALPPQTLQQDGSVVLAKEGAQAPVVEVYADFQCPACKQFETASGSTLQELAAAGEAVVHYRPVSIFALQPDPISTNSLRGAAAARAAADAGKFVEYNDILFENQPVEGRPGFAVEDLKKWGEEAGITDPAFAERVDAEAAAAERFAKEYAPALVEDARKQMSDQQIGAMPVTDLIAWGDENGHDSSFLDDTYVQQVLQATTDVNGRYSGANAFSGTPTVYLNGQKMGDEMYSASGLRDAVAAAGPGEVQSEPLESGDGAAAEEDGKDGGKKDGDAAEDENASASPEAKE
ncbi:thioredoxin domain-containing protein [Nocardiopsis sp. CNT-189]|uniref:DsbA family protein n=1 Tax=Nocardiopsis oceanisediminis TaxID=2816862 RepID=UPI003B2BF73D